MVYKKILKKTAHFQAKHPYWTLLLILAITLAFFGGVSQVRTVASLEQMMPKDVEEIKAFNSLRDQGMGQDMIGIVIEIDRQSTNPHAITDIRDYKIYGYVNQLEQLIRSEQDIINTFSAVGVIQGANPNPTEEQYAQLIRSPQMQNILSSFINNDYTSTIIIASTDVSADDERMNLLATRLKKDLESAGSPPGIDVKITGTPIIQQQLGELIAKDRANTRWISTVAVFIITALLFASVTSAVVPIIIVTLSVNWLYGTMGYANLPISTLAGGVAAMVIGIGIDYAIHLMNKFKYERKKGLDIKEAVEQAVVDTGSALTGASVATILAFIAFLIGAMPEMGRFGLLMAIGVFYSFILSIFGLPSLLIIEEDVIRYFKTRVHFGIEGEYKLYGKDEVCPDDMKEVDISPEEMKDKVKKKYKVMKRK